MLIRLERLLAGCWKPRAADSGHPSNQCSSGFRKSLPVSKISSRELRKSTEKTGTREKNRDAGATGIVFIHNDISQSLQSVIPATPWTMQINSSHHLGR